jgi:hypothetical protein
VVRNRKSKKDGQYKEQDEQTNNGQQNTKIKPNIDNTNPPKNCVETPGTRGKDSSPSFFFRGQGGHVTPLLIMGRGKLYSTTTVLAKINEQQGSR